MRFKTVSVQVDEGDAVVNARAAARKVRDGLTGFSPSLVIFFAATNYDADTLAREIDDAFPDATTMGCTSSGEARDGKILNDSVVAMAFSAEALPYCRTALVLKDAPAAGSAQPGVFSDTKEAMAHLGRKLPGKLIDMDYREYVGFMLGDQISAFTESVLEKVGELTNVLFVGGFAGDDYKFLHLQRVFYRGKAYSDAAVLALWKPARGFSLLKTQAVELTDKSMVITRADEENRIIWEFDGEDAAAAYARAIGVPAECLDILDFDENPLAVTVDGEPYLRALVKTVDGRGLQMFAQVHEGTRYTVTKAGDALATTGAALRAKLAEMGHVEAILHVNCASRHTALKKFGQVEGFAELFADTPSIAFSSYGEIYVGIVAMTSTMILFK